jgi:hypothetical protein
LKAEPLRSNERKEEIVIYDTKPQATVTDEFTPAEGGAIIFLRLMQKWFF